MVLASGILALLLLCKCLMTSVDSFLMHTCGRCRYQESMLLHSVSTNMDESVESSLEVLALFNKNYLERMKLGRREGKSPMRVELERAQLLKADGIKREREELRQAVSIIQKHSIELSLGIMSETGKVATETLKSWVNALNLARGELHGVDDSGDEVSAESFMDQPVYIKYNSSAPNKAYIKKYKTDGYVGVIIQPVLADREFRQYGDLPLKLF